MAKNQILSDMDHRERWDKLAPMAKELAQLFTRDQLQELHRDLERWIDWSAGEDPVFDEEAPNGAELLTALLNEAETFAAMVTPPADIVRLP